LVLDWPKARALIKNSSWFAGFFDAEGYFSIRNMYALTLSVGQKDKEILEKIKSSFGVGKIFYDTSWKGYNYVVCSRKELDVFMEPWPWDSP
jgi:hypothetical protein